MKVSPFPPRYFVTLLLTLLLAGCASRKTDWGSRVGSYTSDQAIAEFGPPDKQAKLSDGTLVAEWLTRRGYRQSYAGGFYYAGGTYGSASSYVPYPLHSVDTYSPDFFLRLTFGPDGRLQSWKKLTK